MTCIVWATIWFSNFQDAFDYMDLLPANKKFFATVTVSDKSGTVQYCQQFLHTP